VIPQSEVVLHGRGNKKKHLLVFCKPSVLHKLRFKGPDRVNRKHIHRQAPIVPSFDDDLDLEINLHVQLGMHLDVAVLQGGEVLHEHTTKIQLLSVWGHVNHLLQDRFDSQHSVILVCFQR
jgi:hypothetical protein